MSSVAQSANASRTDALDQEVSSTPSLRQLSLLNESPLTTLGHSQSQVDTMPSSSWLTLLPNSKYSLPVTPRTTPRLSFKTTSPTYSPTLASPRQSYQTEEPPLSRNLPWPCGSSFQSKPNLPRPITPRRTAKQSEQTKSSNNTFGSIATTAKKIDLRSYPRPNSSSTPDFIRQYSQPPSK
jgi:hypothetical protein